MSELGDLLTAISAILSATCWPIIILGGLVLFRQSLQDFFSSLSEFTFKAGASGVEASAKKYEAAAMLGAATAKRNPADAQDSSEASNIGRSVGALNDQQLVRLSDKHILWVDDNPANNNYEMRALAILGVQITTSLSTSDALEKLSRQHYDLIITDFARAGEKQAGYALIDAVKQRGFQIPIIIYSSSTTSENRQAARRRGALEQTNNPQQLFELVFNALLARN